MKTRLPLLLASSALVFAGCQSPEAEETAAVNARHAPAAENATRPTQAQNVARIPAQKPITTESALTTVPDERNQIQLMEGTDLYVTIDSENRSTDAQWAVFFRENAEAVLEDDFPMNIQFSEGARDPERGRTALEINLLDWRDNGSEAVCRIEADLADGPRSNSLGTYTGVKSIDNGSSASREARDDAARDALEKLRADLLALMRAPMD